MRKLLVIGTNTIHTYNYIDLVSDYFDEIVLITDSKRQDSNVKSHEVDFRLRIKNLWRTTKQIRQIANDFSPTYIHIHQANSVAFFTFRAKLSKRFKTVLTAWGSDILLVPKMNWLLKKMVQFNLRKANGLTSDSIFMADEMVRLIGENRKILIANFGINVEPIAIEKENIIYSNRLHKKLYNIDKIIEAFEIFRTEDKSGNAWKLVIAATGEETEQLKKMALNSNYKNDIEFVGWINKDENAFWYSKSKIWISIPDSDATSISLLEAMACGCIPIVSDLPANHEWVDHQKSGIIVAKNQKSFIAEALTLDVQNAININKNRIELDGLKSVNRLKFIKLYEDL